MRTVEARQASSRELGDRAAGLRSSSFVVDPHPAAAQLIDDEVWEDSVVWPDAPHPAGTDARAIDPDPVGAAVAELVAADRAVARAVAAIRQARLSRTVVRRHGMPIDRLLILLAERTGTDVRFLCRAEQRLTHMPTIDAAFADGALSWSQVRGIISATDGLRVAELTDLDDALEGEIGQGEPDRIIQRAFAHADAIRFEERPEDPAPDPGERRRLFMEPDLFGGAAYHGYDTLDAVTTIFNAAAAAADAPHADTTDDDEDDRPLGTTNRQAQLAEGLRRVAAAYGNEPTAQPPKPSISVVIDRTDLAGGEGRALVAWYGGPIRLHPTVTERFACDQALDTFIVDGQRPVAVGDSFAPITTRHRRILTAVDRGCRMPGCSAPPQHCDAHHVTPRIRGGPTTPDNLALLCRPCHVHLHAHEGLDLTLDRHTRAVTLTIPDGRTFTSLPT